MDSTEPDVARKIGPDWPGLPADLDAALAWPTKYKWVTSDSGQIKVVDREAKTFFFKVRFHKFSQTEVYMCIHTIQGYNSYCLFLLYGEMPYY